MIVRGVDVNDRTQCAHYRSDRDVVAIKFKCCETFYACIRCHEEVAGHVATRWRKDEREIHAILCGNCDQTLSINDYLGCGNSCPLCDAAFNPECVVHHPFYFEL